MTAYTSAQYVNAPTGQTNGGIKVQINGVQSFVPCDPGNADYQAMMALVSQGSLTITPSGS
jgi:hypothetical protein